MTLHFPHKIFIFHGERIYEGFVTIPSQFPAPLFDQTYTAPLLSKEAACTGIHCVHTKWSIHIVIVLFAPRASIFFAFLSHCLTDTRAHTLYVGIHALMPPCAFKKKELCFTMTRHAARKSLFKCRMQIKAFIELSSQPIYYIANGSSASITLHTLHLKFLISIFLMIFFFSFQQLFTSPLLANISLYSDFLISPKEPGVSDHVRRSPLGKWHRAQIKFADSIRARNWEKKKTERITKRKHTKNGITKDTYQPKIGFKRFWNCAIRLYIIHTSNWRITVDAISDYLLGIYNYITMPWVKWMSGWIFYNAWAENNILKGWKKFAHVNSIV